MISLHPLEKRVLKVLSPEFKSLSNISKETNLSEIEALRALGWLSNKGYVELKESETKIIQLDLNGKKYLKIGLPEKRLFDLLKEKKEIYIADLHLYNFDPNEISISIGVLKKKGAIEIREGKLILINENIEFPEENLIKKIGEGVSYGSLSEDEQKILEELLKRKNIINIRTKKEYFARLTEKGEEIVSKGIEEKEEIGIITRDILINKEWKNKEFRRFDIKLPVKPKRFGKKNPYLEFLNMIKDKLAAMGFKEMEGGFILNNFWNMDSLFMPQDHPAREIHDTFYIKNVKPAEIPQKIFEKVKEEHLRCWKYWNDDFSKKVLLRSQVTALSALTMAREDLEIPGKYFAIEKVFRPDEIDAKHFIEFYQLEGIVLDENITFVDLISLLKLFAKEIIGTEKIKLYPAYFPFTEPSVELFAEHPKLGWMEIGGAGIFREEVTKPFGIDVPVIAWGLGIDRLAMIALGIKDIRYLHTYDLKWLKNKPYPNIPCQK